MPLRFPAIVLGVVSSGVLSVSCIHAQSAVSGEAELFAAPGGAAVAILRPGANVKPGASRGPLTQVTISGFIHAGAIGGKRDTFAISVKAPSGATLRATAKPDGQPLGRLNDGMGLVRDGVTGEWIRVHRGGWVLTRLVQQNAPASHAATAAASAAASPAAAAPAQDTNRAPLPGEMTPVRRTAISNSPEVKGVGTVEPGARIEPVARDRGWVKVRVEGWIKESDLATVDTSVRSAVVAADLRAKPDEWRGKTVRWEVQIIAFQIADALRRELALDEPYLLARGPGADNSLLYLAVPPALVDAARRAASPALQHYVITARVRTGRSEPAGVPILDVVTLTRR